MSTEDDVMEETRAVALAQSIRNAMVRAGLRLPTIRGKDLLVEFPYLREAADDALRHFKADESFVYLFHGPNADLAVDLFCKGAVLAKFGVRTVEWTTLTRAMAEGGVADLLDEVGLVALRSLPDKSGGGKGGEEAARIGGMLSSLWRGGLSMAIHLDFPLDDLGIGQQAISFLKRQGRMLEVL